MKKILLASALATMMGGAFAQVYVGGAYGMTQAEVDCSGTYTCDKSDTGLKVYGGYQLNPNAALEVGYIDFGTSRFSGPYGFTTVHAELDNTALTVAAALRGAFSPVVHGVLRLGVANVETTSRAVFVGVASGSSSETTLKPYLGLGLEYSFNKQLRATLGADFTQGEISGESGSVRSFNAGVQYGF